MPRLIESVPKYRKHKGTGHAVVTINGRDPYLGPHGTKASRIEYDRRITEWLASGRSSSYGVPAHVTSVVELIVAYLEYAKSYYGSGQRHAGIAASDRHAPWGSLHHAAVRRRPTADSRWLRISNGWKLILFLTIRYSGVLRCWRSAPELNSESSQFEMPL